MSVRIIPRLDIKGPNLVKGIHLEGLRVLGKPEKFAKYYYENGADELLYMDVVASLYGRNSLLEMIEKTSKEIFIPLTVGGGIRSLQDIEKALRAGADKVSLNTAVIKTPSLITEAANRFGSSTIVVSIEAKKRGPLDWDVFTDNGRIKTGLKAIEWGGRASELGAGEILVTSIDQEGTGGGMDIELVKSLATVISIPIIACGGVGNKAHVADAVENGFADALAVSSVLHYPVQKMLEAGDDYSAEGNTAFLQSGKIFSKITPLSIKEIKDSLFNQGVHCRMVRT